MVKFPCQGQEIPSWFCSVEAISGLAEVHLRWEGQSALLSLLIQILISSRNTLTDTPKIVFDQISGPPSQCQVDA